MSRHHASRASHRRDWSRYSGRPFGSCTPSDRRRTGSSSDDDMAPRVCSSGGHNTSRGSRGDFTRHHRSRGRSRPDFADATASNTDFWAEVAQPFGSHRLRRPSNTHQRQTRSGRSNVRGRGAPRRIWDSIELNAMQRLYESGYLQNLGRRLGAKAERHPILGGLVAAPFLAAMGLVVIIAGSDSI